MSDMVDDAFGMHSNFEQGENIEETPNEEANIFYEQLRDCSSPLFNGSQHSKLSVAVRLLSIKSDNNISQGAMNSMIDLMRELVDPNVEIPDSYYKANSLVSKLGLSSIRIDCCENGCMLYYKEDVDLESCKFCRHPRYKTGSTGKKLAIKDKYIRISQEYRSILPLESRDRPFTQEENENLWKQSAGEPIRGSVYGYREKAYQKKKSWYCGSSSSSFDGGDRETISAMESKIAYLNAELAAVAEREKKREEREKKREEEIAAAKEVENKRYAALQAQLTFLFESGNILPPCPASSDGSDQEGGENDNSDKESDQGDEE
ncbi:hypothetical protein RDI58_004114 [Solanum bulbocastanum]|uniref:Uncharacterized protein n=1 Tax=Solanum bulbocastanum TaxID=147425 RepID=A0AAN8TX99_SOLBU